jgi:Serine acetyltransferase
MAVFDDVSEEKLLLYPHKIEWREGKVPIAQKADYKVISCEEGEPLKQELNHFIECIQTRNNPRTDGNEGLRVLKVIEAAESFLLDGKDFNIRDMPKDYYLHNSSFIDENVTVGEGTKVWHFSHLLKGSRLGRKCIIGQNVVIGPEVTIGDGCKIQNNVSIYKGVTLEDGVFCGPSCVFTNVYNPRAFVERKHKFKKTIVRKGATIGANATIICGVTIGKYALVGAGAVVKSSIPDHAIVVGIPAKQIGWACKCGVSLKSDCSHYICNSCGNEYETEDNKFKVIKEKVLIN